MLLLDNIDCETGPPALGPQVESSERARQREIAAYLSAAAFPPGLPSGPGENPFVNPDPTLNALVQLGTLRLDCDRAFLSLIDCNHQFIVAEMTRSHYISKTQHDPGDTVYLGVCKLDSCWGVCPTTMAAFMDETGEWIKTGPNIIANRTRYIINDFRADPDYRDRPYISGYPHMVSYLEVPLVSPLGYMLGSYCVVDNKLRDFNNDECIGIMNEIAASIMIYLDLMRMRQSRHRSEQLLDGLSGFIRDEPLSPPPHTTGSSNRPSVATIPETSSDGSGNPDTIMSDYCPATMEPPTFSTEQSSISPLSPRRNSSAETQPTTPDSVAAMDQQEGDATTDRRLPENSWNGSMSSANIKSTFFRAATAIREAMNMDGFMFLDAVPGSCVIRSEQTPAVQTSASQLETGSGPFCATIAQCALDDAGETDLRPVQTQLPEAIMQRLIQKFPRGHVFSADEFGPIDENYGIGKPFPGGRPGAPDYGTELQKDITTLFTMLPNARYVIFLPLWYFQRECWYAAALGWVADSTKVIDVADIGMVSAFGNSIMGEVSRLEAVAASFAKSNFVSSISHELRSPLHGIMTCSELLREHIQDASLLSTLDMLDTCGRTLLDTFTNLLDHAIVINEGKKARIFVTDLQLTDLGGLVEDVMEAVSLSYVSEKAFFTSMYRNGVYTSGEALDVTSKPQDRLVLITLNVKDRARWKLPLNIGAWKRIVMNIFGNALKYTCSGHIEVNLQVLQVADGAGNMRDYVSFSVEDTGCGMTADYLKYEIFTPFSQENTHSPGVGLGLSIVQQLVNGLGGRIDVKSSVSKGTIVNVIVPIVENYPGLLSETKPAMTNQQQPQEADYNHLRGMTACLITPGEYMIRTDTEAADDIRLRYQGVERTLRTNVEEALRMTLIVAPVSDPLPHADVYFIDGSVTTGSADAGHWARMLPSIIPASPLIILFSNRAATSLRKQKSRFSLPGIHLRDPIGPRKLASTISSSLKTTSSDRVRQYRVPPPTTPRASHHHTNDGLVSPPLLDEVLPLDKHGPRRTSDTQSSDDGAVERRQPAPGQRHLLLVDDNPINMKLLSTVVRKRNHRFTTASNGMEAVRLYKLSLEQGKPFDIIFMDITMPVMDGFEATQEIRRLEIDAGVSECKIAALTGLSSEISRNKAFASGCDLFLTKPVRLDKLRGLLDEWLHEVH